MNIKQKLLLTTYLNPNAIIVPQGQLNETEKEFIKLTTLRFGGVMGFLNFMCDPDADHDRNLARERKRIMKRIKKGKMV